MLVRLQQALTDSPSTSAAHPVVPLAGLANLAHLDPQDQRDHLDPQDQRDHLDPQDQRDHLDPQDQRDQQVQRDQRVHQVHQAQKVQTEIQGFQDVQANQVLLDPRDPQGSAPARTVADASIRVPGMADPLHLSSTATSLNCWYS